MIGSFLTRGLILALGYAYPAYECFKTVERNKPEIEQLRFWCQYWILVVALTIFERVGDAFISWLPMYSEAKLAFFIYLWYPKTKGTTYVYETFLRPYVAKHETEIDRNLLELRTRAGDVAVLYWQRAATYGQTRFFEILQFVASQSQSSRPRPAQRQQQPQQARQPPPIVPTRQPSVSQQQVPQPPVVSTARQSSVPAQQHTQQLSPRQPQTPVKSQTAEAVSEAAATAPGTPSSSIQTARSAPAVFSAEAAGPSKPSKAEVDVNVEVTSATITEEPNHSVKDTVMEEAIRVTRGRLRKTRTAGAATTAR